MTDSIINTFGEVVKVESEEVEDELNPNIERFTKAEELGITNGKMNLLNKLEVYYDDNSTFDYCEWSNKSVKAIMEEIKANKKNFDAENIDEDIDKDEAINLDDEDDQDNKGYKSEKSLKKKNNGRTKKK